MSAPMTMNRVVHAAVRRDLVRLASALDKFPDGDQPRARALERAFTNLRDQLTRHHEGEDEHIWPMLAGAGADPELLKAMESEHGAMSRALAETGTAMSTLSRTGAAVDAAAARTALARAGEVTEHHLGHEEDEVEPILVPLMTSPGWKAVEKKLSRQRPRVAGRFFAWVTDGMEPKDRAYLRATVPPPVTYALAHTAGRSYYRDVAPTWRA